jgi:hypothetical protein
VLWTLTRSAEVTAIIDASEPGGWLDIMVAFGTVGAVIVEQPRYWRTEPRMSEPSRFAKRLPIGNARNANTTGGQPTRGGG